MGFSKDPKIRLQADDEVRVTGPEPRPKPDPQATAWQRRSTKEILRHVDSSQSGRPPSFDPAVELARMVARDERRQQQLTDWASTGNPVAHVDLSMTSDRPCISERGMMVHAGTKVTYLGHVGSRAVKCKMEDGSEEILHPHCFPELR